MFMFFPSLWIHIVQDTWFAVMTDPTLWIPQKQKTSENLYR